MDYTGVDPQKYDALVRSRQGGGVGAKFQGTEFGQGKGSAFQSYSAVRDPKLASPKNISYAEDMQNVALQKFNISDTTIADFRDPSKSLQQWSVGGIGAQDYLQPPGKVATGPQIDRGNLPTFGMSSKDYDRRNAYEAWTETYNNQPSGPTEDQVNFYQNNPYRSLMETQRLSSNKQSKRPDIY